MNAIRTLLSLVTVASAAVAVPSVSAQAEPASAQTESEPVAETPEAADSPEMEDTAEAGRNVIEEIVVTAQRREQNLQDVPISVSAITAESLGSMGIASTNELAGAAPGLVIAKQFGATTPYIRGIGTASGAGGQESAVAVYVDGIYVPQQSALNFSFNNIERVEVLRGPQGTLFGRNATGGLIQVITREPTSAPTLLAGLSYDNYQTAVARVYASTSLADDLNGDIAVYHSDQNKGWGTNRFTGKDVYEGTETGLRTSLLFKASPATSARLSVDYTDIDTSIGVARQADIGTRTIDGQGPQTDYWDINSNFDPRFLYEGHGAGLRISHDFESMQLVSLTGYREGKQVFLIDQDSSPVPAANVIIGDDDSNASQELQLQSTGSDEFSWIVGLYYFTFDAEFLTDINAGARRIESKLENQSIAAYAQTTFAVTKADNLTLGARFTRDERDYRGESRLGNGTVSPQQAPAAQTSEEPSWRIALDHRFSPDQLGYISYNRGFKSGSYNSIDPNALPTEAEIVDAYELGLKSDLANGRLRVNTSAFYYDYKDLQVNTVSQGFFQLSNAAKAEVYGGEIEATALPIDNLEVTASLALLQSEFTSFGAAQVTEPKPAPMGGNFACTTGQPAATPNCPDDVRQRIATGSLAGNELGRAPDLTGSLSGRYAYRTMSGEYSVSGSIVHNDGFFWDPENRAKQDAYTLVNAQVDWTTQSKRYRVYAFGKNLTDEKYTQYLSASSLGDLVSAAAPLTFGIGAEARFQ